MAKITSKKFSVKISDSIGKVSAVIARPAKATCMMTMAHGAGAGMDHPFMVSLSNALNELGVATVRFNFPFTENKKNRPDPAPVAEKTAAVVANKIHELHPDLPLFVSGKSFGGRMASHWLSKEDVDFVKGIVFVGFPLHPAGAPSTERATHLTSVRVPMLFLQGTKDALADLALITGVCKKLPSATLITFEKADHSFKAGKENLIPKLATMTKEWMEQVLTK
ncbi:MAG: alpha/beta hydrolase [Cyclobacteriaceae bacterium]|nr:alpha/beta hydrolase [Cyclobacteriaceae bacterium]